MVLLTAAVGLWWLCVPGGGAWHLAAAVLCAMALCALWGHGLLRVLGWQGPWHVAWAAGLPVGVAGGVVMASVPLSFGLSARSQAMALTVTFMGLTLAALLAASPRLELPRGAQLLNTMMPPVGALLMLVPMFIHGAWSVAGHDLDTLQHQDGALHAVMITLAGEGIRAAPGYPLGLHAFLSGMGGALGWTPFQTLCVGLPLLTGALVGGTQWMTASLGASAGWTALAGVLAALHPLLMFTGMEQFGPQLCAAALAPAAVAACVDPVDADRPVVRALLPAVVLAAVLSAYHLALVVVAPLLVAVCLGRGPWKPQLIRLATVGALTLVLAPLGSFRLVQRLSGRGDAQSPVKAATRVKDPQPARATQVLSPDVNTLGEPREAQAALRWDLTAAHLVGVTPYRDHFLRTGRLVQALLGRDAAPVINAPLWAWANAAVPALSLGWLALVLMAGRRRRDVWGLLGVLLALGVGVLWLGAGSGIQPYYAFKLGSLLVGPLTALAVLGMVTLPPRTWRLVAALVLVSRAVPALAVHAEYGRDLALDAFWTRMVEDTQKASFQRSAAAVDASPTRRYWNSRLLLARAREGDAESAHVVLCARNEACLPHGQGRVVTRSGPYTLWVR